jgi:hypothetical protein
VCPGVTFAGVRFDFSDPDGNRRLGFGALEYAAEKGRGDLKYVASKETTAREIQSVKVTHRTIVRAGNGSHRVTMSVMRFGLLAYACAFVGLGRLADKVAIDN